MLKNIDDAWQDVGTVAAEIVEKLSSEKGRQARERPPAVMGGNARVGHLRAGDEHRAKPGLRISARPPCRKRF